MRRGRRRQHCSATARRGWRDSVAAAQKPKRARRARAKKIVRRVAKLQETNERERKKNEGEEEGYRAAGGRGGGRWSAAGAVRGSSIIT